MTIGNRLCSKIEILYWKYFAPKTRFSSFEEMSRKIEEQWELYINSDWGIDRDGLPHDLDMRSVDSLFMGFNFAIDDIKNALNRYWYYGKYLDMLKKSINGIVEEELNMRFLESDTFKALAPEQQKQANIVKASYIQLIVEAKIFVNSISMH